ncbi:MAG: Tetratricopeptide repeat protein [Myxococcales bacterium]|nr:Tetratricopeptide repeat protein [Myxococcales bacterium]
MARALIAILLTVGVVAHADVGPQAIETYLARGQVMYDEQEYAAAIQALSPVTRDARATRAQRLRALELIALAHFIRGDEGAARVTFERILDIDPGYQLRDTTGSPKIRAFFDDMKKQLIPGFDPEAGADLEHAVPTAGTAGRTIELEARATRGGERVFELVVATRRRGELGYRLVTAAPRGDARWRARVAAEPSGKPYVLEYYVEARDAGGAAVARIAAPDAPLEIALAAGSVEAGKRAWYTRWYVYAGVAVVAAGVTGIAVAATRGPDPGSLPPGSVTVSP